MSPRGSKEALVSDNEESEWRIIRVCSWKSLSCNIAFFCFLRSLYVFFFLLTADTSRDEAQAASLSEGWLNHEHLSLSARFCYQDEIHRFSSCLVLALFCFLSKDFSTFWSVSWRRNGFQSVTTVLNVNKTCNRVQWSRILAVKSRLRVKWLMKIMTPLRLLT